METRGRGHPPRITGVPVAPTAPLAPTLEAEFRAAIAMLTHLVAAQNGNRGSPSPSSSSQEPTTASRLRDFLRMNPPIYTRSKVEEDPQNFIDEI